MFSTAVLFAKDSPFALGLYSPSLGFLGVLTFGYAIHAYDRYLHRKEIGRVPQIRRSSSIGGVNNTGLTMEGLPVEEQVRDKVQGRFTRRLKVVKAWLRMWRDVEAGD